MATAQQIFEPLPSPADRPQADVVLYDGHCKICTRQARRMAAWDRSGRLAFLPLASSQVASRWPALRNEDLMREMHVVEPTGQVHRGGEAFRYLTRRLPRLYWAAPLLHFPGSLPFWNWAYQQVARRRYKLGKVDCDGGTCHLHG